MLFQQIGVMFNLFAVPVCCFGLQSGIDRSLPFGYVLGRMGVDRLSLRHATVAQLFPADTCKVATSDRSPRCLCVTSG